MNWFKTLRLYDPDDTDPTDDNDGKESPPPVGGGTAPAAVGMDTVVTLADGSKTTVGELAKAKSERDALQGDVNTIFSGAASKEEKIEATRRRLQGTGKYGQAEIEQYLAQAYSEGVDEDDDDDDEEEDNDNSQGGGDNQMSDERLERLEEAQRRQNVEMLKGKLEGALSFQLDNHPGVGSLLEKAEAIARLKNTDRATGRVDEGKVKESVEKAKGQVRKQMERALLERVKDRRGRQGAFSPEFFQEESGDAAKDVVSLFQTALVDLDMIGKVPDTVSGSEEFTALEGKKPAPAPKFDESDPETWDVQKQVSSFTEDRLMRLAAEASTGESRV